MVTMIKYVMILTLVLSVSISKAGTVESGAGFEFGGNGTTFLSDLSLKAYGMGAGYQMSVFGTFFTDKPITAKFRYETIRLREVALAKTDTSFLSPSTQLKSMTQPWSLFSIGIEGHFEAHGQNWFWETLIGYAFGSGGQVTLTPATADTALVDINQQTASRFFLSGGLGLRRKFSERVSGVMSVRTFGLIGSIYSSEELSKKTIILVPVLFNIGLEFPFRF